MKWGFFYFAVFLSLGLGKPSESYNTRVVEVCEYQPITVDFNTPQALPLDSSFQPRSRKFGMHLHPIFKLWKMHTGIDVTAPSGTPIKAAGNGVVTKAEYSSSGYGNVVEITHNKRFKTRYAHASKIIAKVGEAVEVGDTIALVGSTGQSTGAHLHFELLEFGKQVDPQTLLYR